MRILSSTKLPSLALSMLLGLSALKSQTLAGKVGCPEPTNEMFAGVCSAIYEKSVARDPNTKLGYGYEEELWKLSCADPLTDPPDIAYRKIRAMWMKYRTKFRCYKYPNTVVPDSNVGFFAMDTGLSAFLLSAAKKYKLDMNFIDPANDKTLMDFLQEQIEKYKRDSFSDKVEAYQRIYDIYKAVGSMHSAELIRAYKTNPDMYQNLKESIELNSIGDGYLARLRDNPKEYFRQVYQTGMRNYSDATAIFEKVFNKKITEDQKILYKPSTGSKGEKYNWD